MNRSLDEIFKSLEGNWQLDRTIYDVLENVTYRATGNASFAFLNEQKKDSLYYEEEGILALSHISKNMKFKRKFIYKYVNDAIEIFLEDGVTKGQLFQKLENNPDNCNFKGTEHICRKDKHNGDYFFENEKSFQTKYTVKGAKTNLKITTYYKKLESSTQVP